MTKRNRLLTALLTLVALCAILFSFASCGKDKYPEIKSSKKEATVVATLGGHDVKYELFRAYFSQMYSGKTSGMTEEEWNEAKTAVLREIAELYATFDVASESGVDPYGSAINDEVKELVRIMYEGGEVNGEYVGGFESREEYKAALAAANLSDAANRLIFRYSATQAALFDYLVKNYSNGAKDPTSLGDPETFFNSDACTRGVWVAVFDDVIYYKDQTLQGRCKDEINFQECGFPFKIRPPKMRLSVYHNDFKISFCGAASLDQRSRNRNRHRRSFEPKRPKRGHDIGSDLYPCSFVYFTAVGIVRVD